MKKTLKSRLVGGLLTAVFAVSLLPVPAIAADCTHETLVKGLCQNESCKKQFVAQVDGKLYEDLTSAITEAGKLEDKAVVLLADLADAKVDLGEAYLTVLPDGKADGVVSNVITIKDTELTGTHANQLILNKGSLVLSNVTATNTNGEALFAVYTVGEAKPAAKEGEPVVTPDPVELNLVSGEYTAKYAMGVKQATLRLSQLRTAEKPELAGVPKLSGKTAAFQMDEGGMIEVMTDLGADTTYPVEAVVPGIMAHMGVDGATVTPVAKWFACTNGVSGFDAEGGFWTMMVVLKDEAVAMDSDKYTYDGAEHKPAVTVTVGGETLTADTDYTVSVEPASPVNAGEYTLTVVGKGSYSGTVTKKFVIEAAAVTPTVTVETPADGFHFTGSALTPNVTVKAGETVLPAESYTVAYTNNTAAGTATVTVTPKEGGNYSFTALTANFEILSSAQTALEITGKTENVVYGVRPLQLGTTGGNGSGAVTWEITKGGTIASVDADGKLTVKGAGAVTVKATKAAADGYDAVTAEWSFDVQPAALTITGATAGNKAYDGKTTVIITAVQLDGIVGSDDVKVDVTGLTGELSSAVVGVYDAVKLGNMSLSGAAASNYKLTVPTGTVPAKVTVTKADLPAALDSIEVTLPVSTTNVEVPNLGVGMPADAGTLKYINRTQDTDSGNKVIVLKWGVDASGKLTSEIVNASGGDKITYTVVVESQNYNNAEMKVIVTMGAEAVDASKITVTPASTSLTYNGADQKPAVTVKIGETTLVAGTDYDVTYPADCKNVGDKEITVTFKGKYTGTATGKYTITKAKVTVSGGSVSDKTFDGGTGATVNVGTVSGLVKGDDVKVTAKGLFADKNSGSGKKVSVTYSLTGKAAGNYELVTTSATLTGRIYSISANSLYNKIGSLSTSNANSGKKQTLQSVVTTANLALSDGGLASSERNSITAAKSDAEVMLSRIESAAAAANTDSIKATENVTKDNVKLTDRSALAKAQTDLNTALTTYSGNYTDGEAKELQSDKTRVADALAVVTRVESAQSLIQALPEDYSTVTTVTAEAVKAADEAYNGLSDHGKTLITYEETAKLNNALEAVDGVTPTDAPTSATPNVGNAADKDDAEEKPVKFPMWIIWIALLLASGSAVGYLLWYKKKQEEEEEDTFIF